MVVWLSLRQLSELLQCVLEGLQCEAYRLALGDPFCRDSNFQFVRNTSTEAPPVFGVSFDYLLSDQHGTVEIHVIATDQQRYDCGASILRRDDAMVRKVVFVCVFVDKSDQRKKACDVSPIEMSGQPLLNSNAVNH
ncbi:hypothetical protein [Pseudomonas monsensis]|uniref:hypothetical protein n=1 Tax=Pseudomonas monsensis TaxID=2745509 RepID=UPI003D1D33BE